MLRIALSPILDISIDDLSVVLVNHILSKQLDEELIVRIDDIDNKDTKNSDKKILEILNLFSIDYSRVIYQSENIKYHTQMAMKLLLDKKSFNCFCSDEALKKDKQKAKKNKEIYSYSGFCQTISDETKFQCNAPFVVRINKPLENVLFRDIIKGDITYEPNKVDSFLILNKDKTPTYNFACGVDDMLYDISTVVSVDGYMKNSAKQIHLRNLLGYDKQINYIHLPSINKKDEFGSVKFLIDEGYLPVAIANYLITTLYDTPTELFTIEECISWFDINKVLNKRKKFDIEKLNFLNKQYIKTMDNMRLSKIIGFADTDIGKLAKIYLEQFNTIKQIKEKIKLIFTKKSNPKDFEKEFLLIKECLQDAPYIDDFNQFKKYIIKKTNIQEDNLLKPLQYILIGTTKDFNLDEIYPLIKNYLGEII